MKWSTFVFKIFECWITQCKLTLFPGRRANCCAACGQRAKICTTLEAGMFTDVKNIFRTSYIFSCYYFLLSDTREKLWCDTFSTIYSGVIKIIIRLRNCHVISFTARESMKMLCETEEDDLRCEASHFYFGGAIWNLGWDIHYPVWVFLAFP